MTYQSRENIEHPIRRVYVYGSAVYGTKDIPTQYDNESDIDHIVVVDAEEELEYNVGKDITVYSEPLFLQRISEHHISVLECIFQFEGDMYAPYFVLDNERLRHSISSVASNSFVKCKKKLEQGDYYIGKKSLFHSLRILDYGIQIAKHGKIVDYKSMNDFYIGIMSLDSNDWEVYKDKYKPIYNQLKSEFKELAPLDNE